MIFPEFFICYFSSNRTGKTRNWFMLQNALRLCVPFSYFYRLSRLSIYLPLLSIIFWQCFSMVLLDVSSNNFSQKYNFDHFGLILFEHLSRKILFFIFVYLLLHHITYSKWGKVFWIIFWIFCGCFLNLLCIWLKKKKEWKKFFFFKIFVIKNIQDLISLFVTSRFLFVLFL